MTREERDKTIRILQWLHDNNFLFRSTEEDVKFATEYAIKALEKESVLDKIRAEIMSKDGLEEALEIIDKYKSEFEPKIGHCKDCKWWKDRWSISERYWSRKSMTYKS